jgi:hypothetical protein
VQGMLLISIILIIIIIKKLYQHKQRNCQATSGLGYSRSPLKKSKMLNDLSLEAIRSVGNQSDDEANHIEDDPMASLGVDRYVKDTERARKRKKRQQVDCCLEIEVAQSFDRACVERKKINILWPGDVRNSGKKQLYIHSRDLPWLIGYLHDEAKRYGVEPVFEPSASSGPPEPLQYEQVTRTWKATKPDGTSSLFALVQLDTTTTTIELRHEKNRVQLLAEEWMSSSSSSSSSFSCSQTP